MSSPEARAKETVRQIGEMVLRGDLPPDIDEAKTTREELIIGAVAAAIRAAEIAEREACAKVAVDFPTIEPATGSANVVGADFDNLRGYIAAAIRARSKA